LRPTQEWLTRPGGLAPRLRTLRNLADLTGEELASRAGWDRTKVSKIENGRTMPTEADIRAWTEVTGQPEQAADLLALLAEGQALHVQWRHEYRIKGQAGVQQDFDALVRESARIRDFETLTIPGLLQTPDYARVTVLEAMHRAESDPDKVDEAVAARMQRQTVLYDTSKTFEFAIMQAALDYPRCEPDVMAGQVDRLSSLIGMSNVTFGIITPGIVLPLTPLVGFLMCDDTTVIERFTGDNWLTGPESAKHGEIFDDLMALAVTGDEARRLLAAAAVRLSR
jgi:transcriptional regulator with XRE-family HTH domain